MTADLNELLRQARARVEAMTPEEKAEMIRQQAEGYARAEASWPKPQYHYENGVKVYDSYEDYCND